jgi:hypothetical protein
MTPNSFTVSWTAPSGTPPLLYSVQYREQGSSNWLVTPETLTTSQIVDGLLPGHTYEVRVQVRNNFGVNYSQTAVATTPSTIGFIFQDVRMSIEWGTTAPAPESASGTTLTSTSGSIVDATGATWTLVNGTGLEARRNGAVPGTGAVSLTTLLYYQRTIYYKNASFWFSWNGSSWVASTDPRVAPPTPTPTPTPTPPESSEDTTLTSNVGTIVDTGGLVYALQSISAGLSVVRNGVEIANSINTVLALYHGHVLYRQNNANLWFALRSGAFVSYPSDPRLPIIYLGDGRSITDSSGQVWSLVDVSGGRVTRNGVSDTTMNNVKELALVSGKIWRNVPSTGLWWFWDASSSTWLPNGGTTISPVSVTRAPWDHPGGSGSVYNTPMGDGAVFGAASDADTIDIARGWNGNNYTAGPVGVINPISNFGVSYYVGRSTDPQFTFTSNNNGRWNTGMTDSGGTLTATLHVPVGAIGAGPYDSGADNPIVLYDPVNFPIRQYSWGGVPIPPPGLQPGQGPFTGSQGEWDDATSDKFGEDADTGLAGYNIGAGLITGYDTDPNRNPAYPRIQHALRYSTDGHLLRDNATVPGQQLLKPDSWPQRLQDGQSGFNLYTGNLKAGTTLAIPMSTPMPGGLNANQQGLILDHAALSSVLQGSGWRRLPSDV